MRNCLLLILLTAVLLAGAGCDSLAIYPKRRVNFYRGSTGDLGRIRRICFVQLAENTGYPEIARRMSRALQQELQELGLFHVDLIPAGRFELRDLDLSKREPYTIRELAKIREDLHCDAVMFGRITSFKPYPSTQVGLYVRLMDLKDGRLVWAIDDVWDTTERETVARIQRYFFREMRETYQPVGDELAIMGTGAFQKFVSHEVVETIDPHSDQKSLPRQFFESPTGIDLRRIGRGAQKTASNTLADF
ncbi:MAG: hypothetical protein GVY16_04720 [Planctomycetes bacterium]|nr:hypothetical protein [Phycisphaerae bacterium]NBB95025.1 hypothetical protein [Planctomycetota bacterium]